ncbi:DUF4197 domain-containing protein [bacterium SCSIO 12741]|nr:DUF4197 domain-containing protein [bacterium SCSIO 12741]
MRILLTLSLAFLFAYPSYSQIDLGKLRKEAEETLSTTTGGKGTGLSNDEVIAGLKEALNVGIENAVKSASVVDGFNKNLEIRIPFPPEAEEMKKYLLKMGMQSQVDEFEETLNRAAEEASKDATEIFIAAIKQMSIEDGFTILNGNDDAASQYLKKTTYDQLYDKFKPIVVAATQKVQVTKYWNPLASTYNKVPFVKKVNPDLEDYVTKKAIDGLFVLVAQEEQKIRKDPAARVTDILKKVFK